MRADAGSATVVEVADEERALGGVEDAPEGSAERVMKGGEVGRVKAVEAEGGGGGGGEAVGTCGVGVGGS